MLSSTKILTILIVVAIVGSCLAQDEASTSNPRKGGRRIYSRVHRKHNETDSDTKDNKTASSQKSDAGVIPLDDKDKYYEDDDYTYEEVDDEAADAEAEEEDKFIETSSGGIVFDHVDFVVLRLKHISMRTSSNISEILRVQEQEFKVNTHYQQGWATAAKLFNDSKRDKIFENTSPNSIVQQVPIEYHIAIIAYTLGEPSMYYEFNKDTREVCSGTDIDKYQWKSYFKLLQLAVATLGSQTDRWKDNRRFLYRGASGEYNLKEGQILAFQHFISTSAALISAENFAGKTLFEFQGLYNGTAMAIWDHSFYEHEAETLFSPAQVFQVDSIHVGSHYTRYVLVKHELSQPCNDIRPNGIEKVDLSSNWLRQYSSASRSIYENSLLITTLFLFSACYSII